MAGQSRAGCKKQSRLHTTCRAPPPRQAGLSLPIHGHLEFEGPGGCLSLEPVLLHPILPFQPEALLGEHLLGLLVPFFGHCSQEAGAGLPGTPSRLLWHFSSQHPVLPHQLHHGFCGQGTPEGLLHLAVEEHTGKKVAPPGTTSSWAAGKANLALGILAREAGQGSSHILIPSAWALSGCLLGRSKGQNLPHITSRAPGCD